jgi:RHS repeat-associated protein
MRTKYKIEEQDKLYYVTLLKHRTRHKVTNRDMGYGAWSQSEPAESDFIATQTVTTDYVSNKIYKNGQLSMLLTEEGYIEKSGSTYTHHYYLKDHIGNHRIVLNSAGTVVQATNYYPSGTTMADYPRATTQGVQPYKFGGKELDRKDNLNFYDCEARAYDPALMRFTSTDPMMEKYYAWSPFAYCHNNPVNRIDPDGMDDYEVSHNGRVVKVAENEERDIVYSLNKKGERLNSKEYEYRTVKLSSAKEGSDNYYILQVKGDDQAQELFEFLATPENFGLKAGQNVEWGRTLTGEAGKNGLNFLTTSQSLGSEKAGSYLFDNQLKYGYTIRGRDHNHPTNNPHPSGTGSDNGDIPVMNKWKNEGNVSPNAQFRIFTPGLSKKYNTYTESYSIPLPAVSITAKRKGNK